MKIEDKLYLTRFITAKESHLSVINPATCQKCQGKPCTFICPARVYTWEDEHLNIAYEGCLECGTCRYGCPYDNIDWHNPRGGFGVSYKFG